MRVSRTARNVALVVFIASFAIAIIRSWWISREEQQADSKPAAPTTSFPRPSQKAAEAISPWVEQPPQVATPARTDEIMAKADVNANGDDLTKSEIDNARAEMSALEKTFAYNPFSGFDIEPEDYARLARVHQEWETKRASAFAAEQRGELNADEVSAALEQIDRETYEEYAALLGAEKVEMMAADMRTWGKEEALPKLKELAKAASPKRE
jgi:hypothetical protein